MAKRSKPNKILWLIGIVVIGYFLLKGGFNLGNQAMVCTSNEPTTLQGYNLATLSTFSNFSYMPCELETTYQLEICPIDSNGTALPCYNITQGQDRIQCGNSDNSALIISGPSQSQIGTSCHQALVNFASNYSIYYNYTRTYIGAEIYVFTFSGKNIEYLCSQNDIWAIAAIGSPELMNKYIDAYSYSCQDTTPSTPTKKDNTILYIGIGFGILMLFKLFGGG